MSRVLHRLAAADAHCGRSRSVLYIVSLQPRSTGARDRSTSCVCEHTSYDRIASDTLLSLVARVQASQCVVEQLPGDAERDARIVRLQHELFAVVSELEELAGVEPRAFVRPPKLPLA